MSIDDIRKKTAAVLLSAYDQAINLLYDAGSRVKGAEGKDQEPDSEKEGRMTPEELLNYRTLKDASNYPNLFSFADDPEE